MTSILQAAEAEREAKTPGPIDTCLRAVQRWTAAAGLPEVGGGTWSVTAWRKALKSGDPKQTGGWTYHDGMSGALPGDILDWAAPLFHVTVLESVYQGRYRSIGSGGPSGLVAFQPTGGGYNPASEFRGYARPPQKTSSTASSGAETPIATQPARSTRVYSLIPLGPEEGYDVVSLVTGNRAHVKDTYELGLLQRVRDNGGTDTMLPAEVDIVKGYLQAINPPAAAAAAAPLTLAPATLAALAKAVNDDAAKRLAQ